MDVLCGSAPNHLFLDDVVSYSCHQSEPVTGTGTFRSFPSVGNYKESDRSQHPLLDHSSRFESDVLWGSGKFHPLPGNQYLLYRKADTSRFYHADARFVSHSGGFLADVFLVLSLQWMTENPYAQLLGGIILGGGFYLAVTRLLRFQELQELFSLSQKIN